MKEDLYRSQFRFPYSLYEKLKEAAEQNRRSVNAELTARLEQSFSARSLDEVETESVTRLQQELTRLHIKSVGLSAEMIKLRREAEADPAKADELQAIAIEKAREIGETEYEKQKIASALSNMGYS